MRTFLVVALLALTVTSVTAHGDHDHDHDHEHEHDHDHPSDVVKAGESTFDSEVASSPLSLVEFFAPWCGHCKALAPQFDKAAAELKGVAKLIAVDCTIDKDLCSKYGVQGFPTLKVFRNDGSKPSEYQGGRQSADIVKFLRKQTEPAYYQITSDAELEAFIKKDGVDILGFFPNLDTAEAKSFVETANSLRNEYNFAWSSDSAHASKYGASAPGAVLLKEEDGKTVHVGHSGAFDAEAVGAFIKAEAFPIVGDIGPENFQKYLDRGLNLVWVFVNNDAAETAHVLSEVSKAAAQHKGKVSVVKLDGVRWGEHAKHFGLSGKLPGIVAEDRENNKNYVFPEDQVVTAEALSTHIQGFLDGTLTATVKSQEIPENNDGPVTTLVGKNFEEIVFDDSKDVLVEFYAPWCGHCKSLAPKYEKLGKLFANNPKVVIAQVDSTENDTPVSIQGFPTIIFYPAGDKKNPITYEGDRTTEAMAKFIRENGKTFTGDEAEAGHDEL